VDQAVMLLVGKFCAYKKATSELNAMLRVLALVAGKTRENAALIEEK
jgi:hypothetical protein